MILVPILAMPDFTQPFIIEIDTYGFSLGAVLLQGQQLCTFFSHILGCQVRLKSIY